MATLATTLCPPPLSSILMSILLFMVVVVSTEIKVAKTDNIINSQLKEKPHEWLSKY
jgi:hypothetical protein